ncbi:hypothetical protein DU002_08370 [Corallincola holothuriorum]|uniref:Uncharacterized protein n=1 Tax=Corallincola holothuriorum TaxID=2282215 RepID=A0A368NJ17_9GAMM|nr:hypothetical protein [Corallincola holothuriorum]RCU50428.1 hypothetical protein DU002_08370 [Corallincola holothuriorum]
MSFITQFRIVVASLGFITALPLMAENAVELPMPNWQLIASPAAGEIKYQHLKEYDDELLLLTGYLDHGAAYAELVDRGHNEQRINLITATLRPYAQTDPQAEQLLATMAHWRAFAKFQTMMEQVGDSQDPAIREQLMSTYKAALNSPEEQRALQDFQNGCDIDNYLPACLSYLASLNEQTMLCIMDTAGCSIIMQQLAHTEQQLIKVASTDYESADVATTLKPELAAIIAMVYRGDLLPIPPQAISEFDFPRDDQQAQAWQAKAEQ